ncbi:MAG: hypothetical protein A4E55_00770 [Pelotomaculum sp. PtaU1.Bin035]|nr:MAG: hypothetical protein A4E55_00770 [Pelotomaculum sp. PtaU1.Bin035]
MYISHFKNIIASIARVLEDAEKSLNAASAQPLPAPLPGREKVIEAAANLLKIWESQLVDSVCSRLVEVNNALLEIAQIEELLILTGHAPGSGSHKDKAASKTLQKAVTPATVTNTAIGPLN